MILLESDKIISANFSFENDEEREPMDDPRHNGVMVNPLIELDVNNIHSSQLYVSIVSFEVNKDYSSCRK